MLTKNRLTHTDRCRTIQPQKGRKTMDHESRADMPDFNAWAFAIFRLTFGEKEDEQVVIDRLKLALAAAYSRGFAHAVAGADLPKKAKPRKPHKPKPRGKK